MTKPLEGHLRHKSVVDQNKEHQSVKLFLILMNKTVLLNMLSRMDHFL